jgi:hypothetical protein
VAARGERDDLLPIRTRDALVELLLESLACEGAEVHLEAALRFVRGDERETISARAREALAAGDLFDGARPLAAWHATARQHLEAYCTVVAGASRGGELRVRLEQARSLFAAGLYFEVHEVLEPAWMESDGEPRVILQGLIQAAAGWYHWTRGNRGGALSLLSAAAEKLARAPASWNDFPLARVRRAVEDWRTWLAADANGVEPPLPFRRDGDESVK